MIRPYDSVLQQSICELKSTFGGLFNDENKVKLTASFSAFSSFSFVIELSGCEVVYNKAAK